jgi:hypothetical protein
LLVGWNSNKIDNPVEAGLASPWLTPAPFAGLGPRVTVPNSTHVYEMLVRNV